MSAPRRRSIEERFAGKMADAAGCRYEVAANAGREDRPWLVAVRENIPGGAYQSTTFLNPRQPHSEEHGFLFRGFTRGARI